MSRRLSWIEVLNEQSRWQSRADLSDWFYQLAGRKAVLLDGTIDGFEEALGYMRRQVANLHFGEPVDLMWLDTQLKTVTLGLLHHQGAQEGTDSKIPRFRARVKGLHDTDLLRAVKDTLLVQFAEFVGEQLDSPNQLISRCEGIHRESSQKPVVGPAAYAADVESRWRSEIAVLSTASDSAADVHRCSNLLHAGPKVRFCSDSCRFATYQLAKSVQEPSYLADKQRRYRRRQEKKGS